MLDNLLEVRLREKDDFLKIVETLTRIGISTRDKKLVQTCHLFHKRGKYYICHFKELFKLDGKPTNIDESDIGRRNTIVGLLEQWNLVSVVSPQQIVEPRAPLSQIKIIPFKEKSEWKLTTKYSIGSNNS